VPVYALWLNLAMTEWASLRDAYGSAEEVPVLLTAAAAAGMQVGDCWDDLWSHLCHQGTVYSASYAALPALAEMSLRHKRSGYVAALHLAASIIAANDGPEDPALVRQRYEQELTDLRALAAANLQYAKDDIEFVYGLEVLMAFEDGGVWQRNLSCLANGEAEIDCPSCDEHLLVDLDGSDFQVASFTDASLASTAITPTEPSATTIEGRLLALANNRPALSAKLPYLFGDTICPRCHAPFQISQTFA
jgi:hypothetical protein